MFKIRRASEADAHTLTELGRSTFIETFAEDNRKEDMDHYVAETYGVDKQLAEIRDSSRQIEIAWSGEFAAGYLHLKRGAPHASVSGEKPIELLRIYVDARWQGKGVGAALMDRGIEIARQEGFKTLWLGVWERNLKAQAFYARYGFVRTGTHIFRLGTDDQTDFILARAV